MVLVVLTLKMIYKRSFEWGNLISIIPNHWYQINLKEKVREHQQSIQCEYPQWLCHALSHLFCTQGMYTLGKKGCYTPTEDNKTNVDQTFVFPLGWNWHDMDPWLFPNEIRHYFGQTFNARSSGIVELRNHSISGRSPKSNFTLWQLWINICIFFSKVFLIVRTMPRPTPVGIRHEVFALAREGIKQGAIAACVGLTRATVNRILKRHAATGSLVPGKSSGAPRKTIPRQDRALLRMVRQDRFLSARALTARMRNLYGMGLVAQRLTTDSCPVITGHIDTQRSPCWLPTTVVPLGVGAEVAKPDSGPLAACHLQWWVEIPTLPGRWQSGERFGPGCQVHRVQYRELSTIAPNPLSCSLADISPVCSIGAFCKTP